MENDSEEIMVWGRTIEDPPATCLCVCFVKNGKYVDSGDYFCDDDYWEYIPEIFATEDETYLVITSIEQSIAEGKNNGVCFEWTWYVSEIR